MIANTDERVFRDPVITTLDEHILDISLQTIAERGPSSSDKDASTADVQENNARRAVNGNSLDGPTVSQESPSKAIDQQSSRRSITATPDDQTSKTNGELRTDGLREEGEGRTKRKRPTGDFRRASQGRNGGQNQSTQKKGTKPQNNKNHKSNKNTPVGRKQAGGEQVLETNGHSEKNNKHRRERVGQSHNQHYGGPRPSQRQSYALPSTAPLHPPTQQQPQFTPIPPFSTYNEFQHQWSHDQSRKPYMAYSGYQEEYAHPQVAHPHQMYAYQPFEQHRYIRDTAPKHLLIDQQPTRRGRSRSRGSASSSSEIVQPINQAFTSGVDRAGKHPQPPQVNALHYPLIVGSGARTSSPISYASRITPQSSMLSGVSPGVTSVTTTTISSTSQGTAHILEVQEFEYSPAVQSAGKDSIESDVEVGGQDKLSRLERCESIPAAYSLDLELGIKPLNRHGTYPQGGAINWVSTGLCIARIETANTWPRRRFLCRRRVINLRIPPHFPLFRCV
jgi:hypothetical protein